MSDKLIDLHDVDGSERLLQRSVLLDEVGEGSRFDVLEYDVEVGVSRYGVDVLDYVEMVELAEQLYFLMDRLKCVRVDGWERHLLDSHGCSCFDVDGFVYNSNRSVP